MAYTETTTKSYGERLGNAFKGVITGFAAFIIGTLLLFWNEGNFVKTLRALNEAEGATVVVDDVSTLDGGIDGKLIHASATAITEDILEDSEFGVSENAISLARKVEYYQYEESSSTQKRDKLGGGEETVTTYTYKAGWRSRSIDSSDFKDPEYRGRNFTLMALESRKQYARNVSFGAYTLPEFFVESISGDEPVDVQPNEEQMAELTQSVRRHPRYVALEAGEPVVHLSENVVFFGKSPNHPQIGDVRVTFTKVAPSREVSLIGKVNGSTFGRYVAKNGKTISRLESGVVSAEEMFANAQSENKILTWILRAVGIALVCGGLRGIFGVLEAIAKVVPFLGNVVGAGVGMVCAVFGIAWSFLWIAIAWLTYRPLIGVPLVAASVAMVFWLKKRGSEKSPSEVATPEEAPSA